MFQFNSQGENLVRFPYMRHVTFHFFPHATWRIHLRNQTCWMIVFINLSFSLFRSFIRTIRDQMILIQNPGKLKNLIVIHSSDLQHAQRFRLISRQVTSHYPLFNNKLSSPLLARFTNHHWINYCHCDTLSVYQRIRIIKAPSPVIYIQWNSQSAKLFACVSVELR